MNNLKQIDHEEYEYQLSMLYAYHMVALNVLKATHDRAVAPLEQDSEHHQEL